MLTPLRLVVMGTGPFAVPTLRALYRTPHTLAALVTQPARRGAGKPPPPSPMRSLAVEQGTPVFDPESINSEEARTELKRLSPDLFVVADYGQILRPETLGIARLGGVNLHGSLLPAYRGASPINWAIYYGETESGVTVIHMSPRIDAGPCLAQARLTIDPDETAVELETRLAELGAPLICETIEKLAASQAQPLAQDPALATKAPRLKKSDGAIDWSRSAMEIKNQIRALEPWPRTYTYWERLGHEPLRLILGRVTASAGETKPLPGTVVSAQGSELIVSAGQSSLLRIESLQPAGKRMLPVKEFLRGYPVQPGDRFCNLDL